MTKKLTILILILAAIVVGWFVVRNGAETPGVSNKSAKTPEAAVMPTQSANQNTNTVVYTESGFSPSSLTIKRGETVTFVNQSSNSFWPASALHPTHTVYSGTSLEEHCPDAANESFDACGPIAAGSSWSFTFNKSGSWNYHDHLNASHFGKIVVE